MYNYSSVDNDSSDIHCSDMNPPAGLERSIDDLNRNISISEIKQALTNANRGKACGTDEIPSDVLNNDMSIAFNTCHYECLLHIWPCSSQVE